MMREHLCVVLSSCFEVEYDDLLNPDCKRIELAWKTGQGDLRDTNKLFERDLQMEETESALDESGGRTHQLTIPFR